MRPDVQTDGLPQGRSHQDLVNETTSGRESARTYAFSPETFESFSDNVDTDGRLTTSWWRGALDASNAQKLPSEF